MRTCSPPHETEDRDRGHAPRGATQDSDGRGVSHFPGLPNPLGGGASADQGVAPRLLSIADERNVDDSGMMLARLGWVVYVAAVLFAALVWMLCAMGSLIGLLHGGSPQWFTVALVALLALLAALVGRAVRYELGGG